MKKKTHLSSRQPPTDDQILRRMKRNGAPPPPRRAHVADGPGNSMRPSLEQSPSYPKGCLPQIDAQMAQDKIVGDAWGHYMKSCAALGLDVMTLLRRDPDADIIKLASEVMRRAGLARDAYDAYLDKANRRFPFGAANWPWCTASRKRTAKRKKPRKP